MIDDGHTLKLGGAAAQSLASELRVTVTDGKDRGLGSVTSRGPQMIIGRAESADLRLTDPSVSSFHVELTSTANGVDVRDSGSKNGVFTRDGARILHAVLPPGASIVLGTTTLRLDPLSEDKTDPGEQLASFGRLRGGSGAMRALFAVLARLSPTDLSVLVEGPTGTGKELVAEAIHSASHVKDGPFVVLDCTSVPKTLAESVLFGHERGAFTGADHARQGVFEAAEGGTVFIDEIGELPLELQPKLLRALEQRQITRVGSNQSRPIRVRVLAATWRDLRRMVNDGTFREDLYFRIAQARIAIPPLDDRPDDIPTLVYHFLQNLPPEAPGARMIAKAALEELKKRSYRGNVRELRSTVERTALLAAGETITTADLAFERILDGEREKVESPATVARAAFADEVPVFKDAKRSLLDDFERDYLSNLLGKSGDNLSRASALSGIERHHLRDLLRKHGLRGT